MKLRYVFSAPSMIRLQPSSMARERVNEYSLFSTIVNKGISRLKNNIKHSIDGVDIDLDILFNAFTEPDHGQHINENMKFSFSNIYADSGGLQIVTCGKAIDYKIKKQIYEVQAISDFAMCFDEIPVKSLNLNKSSRSSTSDKLFMPSDIKLCATRTAQNIREQCDIISNINDKTSVFYIVQGNTHDDMYEWFKYGHDVMSDYSRIGGIALADTCMGNGTLETIEMLGAYSRIRSEFGVELTKNHIHLLGLGSVQRLMPVFYSKGSLLKDDITISFDSTSFSMSYMMGKFISTDGYIVRQHEIKSYFSNIVDEYHDIILESCPTFNKNKFISHICDNIMSVANTINRCEYWYVAQAFITLTCIYQMYGFMSNLKREIDEMETSNSPISKLSIVNDHYDFLKWMSDYSRYVDSSRIKRESTSTLDNLFA